MYEPCQGCLAPEHLKRHDTKHGLVSVGKADKNTKHGLVSVDKADKNTKHGLVSVGKADNNTRQSAALPALPENAAQPCEAAREVVAAQLCAAKHAARHVSEWRIVLGLPISDIYIYIYI